MKNYRAIYEAHHGPIGKDANGRSLEIHHVDGNHDNCDITNLKLVTIQEHYNIHKAQGDWGACLIMSHRMNLTPEETADLSRQCQQQRIANGTHNLLGSEHNRKRIEAGTHHFLDKEAARQRNLKRISAGTHNLTTDANPVYELIKSGRHHFQTDNPSKRQVQDGTHHFLNNHPNKIQVTCPHCDKTGGLVNMRRYHFDNCKVAKILPVM